MEKWNGYSERVSYLCEKYNQVHRSALYFYDRWSDQFDEKATLLEVEINLSRPFAFLITGA